MTRPLALHQITAMAAGAAGLARLAAETGCTGICIFTHIPGVAIPGQESDTSQFPLVTAANKGELLAALAETGVKVTNIEFFPVAAGVAVESYLPALALGAELGAARLVTHIHDPEDIRAVETLGRLADLAATLGLGVGLEFMGLTPACNTIGRAAWFVAQVARGNLGLAVDMLHLVRTGGTPGEVAALDPAVFAYAQICDGKGLHQAADYLPEALDRSLPGQGDFPIAAILEALPRAVPIDVEVPNARLVAPGQAVADHAREAVSRSRRLVDAASGRG